MRRFSLFLSTPRWAPCGGPIAYKIEGRISQSILFPQGASRPACSACSIINGRFLLRREAETKGGKQACVFDCQRSSKSEFGKRRFWRGDVLRVSGSFSCAYITVKKKGFSRWRLLIQGPTAIGARFVKRQEAGFEEGRDSNSIVNPQSVELAGKGELALCLGECFRGVEIGDLALGKPCLFPLSTSATVAQALKALKCNKDVAVLSVWVERTADESFEKSTLPKNGGRARDRYRCGALVTILDIICFLARDENLLTPAKALSSPLSALYPSLSHGVEHVHGRKRLCQALYLMLEGVQHLVVPITKRRKKGKPFKIPVPLIANDVPADDYCWITQEDMLRYLLDCIGMFYPLPMMSLQELDMIDTDVFLVDENAEAISALPLIKRASQEMTAVAVVSGYSKDLSKGSRPKLVGDVSIHSMRGCNEMAAEALATLSMKDFLYFVHESVPPQFLVEKVRSTLESKGLTKSNSCCKHYTTPSRDLTTSESPASKMESGIARVDDHSDTMCEFSSTDEELSEYSSSDEELSGTLAGVHLELSSVVSVVKMKNRRNVFPKGRTLITCRPQSSLVAVMAQALAHRANHVWITDDEGGLLGIVTYSDIIDVLSSHIHSFD